MPDPEWLMGKRDKNSKKQEERIAEELGGKRVPASGAIRSKYRGSEGYDVKSDDYAMELKITDKKSIGLKLEWLEKIVQKANDRGKIPMMVLSYKKAEFPTPADWVVIPMDLFKKVMKGDKNEK